MSKQESLVRKILNDLNIENHGPIDISKIVKTPLYKGIIVDLYLPKYNIIIEVHGEQHEKASRFGNISAYQAATNLNQQMNRDSKLINICKIYSINYIEIWYNEDVNTSFVLKKILPYM